MSDIFISYNSKDEAYAQELYERLTKAGFDVWFDKAKLQPGMDFQPEIDAARRAASVVLPVLTPRWRKSQWTHYETYRVDRIIPLLYEGEYTKVAPKPLHAKHYSDLRDPSDSKKWAELFAAIENLLSEAAVVMDEPTRTKPATDSLLAFRVLPEFNPNFTGREGLLEDITQSLIAGQRVAITQAITSGAKAQSVAVAGMGGVGKTQLAAEFAYRHAGDYEIVWWLRAEDTEPLASDYALLAEKLDLPEAQSQRREDAVEAAKGFLQKSSKWLLIFDNAESVKTVAPHLPGGNGHVLITTRNPLHDKHARVLSVDTWPRADSLAFLEKRLDRQDPDFGNLAADLGDLPLALEQAAAYMDNVGLSAGVYRQRFLKNKLAAFPNSPPDDYHSTIATTWSLAFDEIAKPLPGSKSRKKKPLASELLNLCAFLAPDDIPFDLLAKWPLAADDTARDEAIATLRSYSLITVGQDSLSLHRLVQLAARERVGKAGTADHYLAEAIHIVNEVYPGDVTMNFASWPICERLLPHGLEMFEHLGERANFAGIDSSRLANQMGLYSRERADFNQAKKLIEKGIKIGETVVGPDHPDVATDVNNLGLVLKDMGDLTGAKTVHLRSLRMDLSAFGPNHPNVARDINNLGIVLQAQGDIAGARDAFEMALRIDVATYGPHHPIVAISLGNIGGLLRTLGDLPGARKACEQALRIDEATFGPNHPNVARDANNLGMVLHAMGDFAGAREHQARAYHIVRQFLGEDHPNTKVVKGNLDRLPPAD